MVIVVSFFVCYVKTKQNLNDDCSFGGVLSEYNNVIS